MKEEFAEHFAELCAGLHVPSPTGGAPKGGAPADRGFTLHPVSRMNPSNVNGRSAPPFAAQRNASDQTDPSNPSLEGVS